MKRIFLPLVALLPVIAGCMRVQRVQPAEFIPAHSPEVVWVTTENSVSTPILHPHIVGDSLQGTQDWPQQPVTISLKEIKYVQAARPSPTRTALLVTFVGATVAGLVYAIATSDKVGSTYVCGSTLKGALVPDCPYPTFP